MLNRTKVIQELYQLSDKLFLDSSSECQLAQTIWNQIAQDPTFLYRIRAVEKAPWIVPVWEDKLNDRITVAQHKEQYAVLAVDGSQIYPDRHQGAPCYLINVGIAQFNYGMEQKPLIFDSVPSVFLVRDDKADEPTSVAQASTDTVNNRREELELRTGLERGIQLKQEMNGAPFAILFDGSLIFWHLEPKGEQLKEQFLTTYFALLTQLYEHHLPMACYISFPRSKELVNIVRVALCDFDFEKSTAYKVVDCLVDAHIARFFLQPFERTILFKHRSMLSERYPEHLKPYFFYLHTGHEIGRVEIPAWIAAQPELVQLMAEIIVDQTIKGRGYPVCLAEAHEQAVVKGPDRDFFYHLLQKVGIEHGRQYITSQKSLKKRGIGI